MFKNTCRAVIIALLLASYAVVGLPSSAGALTEKWVHWARNGKPTIDALVNQYDRIDAAAKASNVAAAKAAFIVFSNDCVALAVIADSPSKTLNQTMILTAKSANQFAWDGYIYLISQTTANLNVFSTAATTAGNYMSLLTTEMKSEL